MDNKFNYSKEFKKLNYKELKDLVKMMTQSQSWWFDYGHYGPLFIRLVMLLEHIEQVMEGGGTGTKGLRHLIVGRTMLI